eukprot:3036303-Amphidinium_carterae.1
MTKKRDYDPRKPESRKEKEGRLHAHACTQTRATTPGYHGDFAQPTMSALIPSRCASYVGLGGHMAQMPLASRPIPV